MLQLVIPYIPPNGDDYRDLNEDRRARLREIELKAVQYQDELECGQRTLKSGWTIQQQVEHYRRKLLRKVSCIHLNSAVNTDVHQVWCACEEHFFFFFLKQCCSLLRLYNVSKKLMNGGMIVIGENQNTQRKACSSATSSTTNWT